MVAEWMTQHLDHFLSPASRSQFSADVAFYFYLVYSAQQVVTVFFPSVSAPLICTTNDPFILRLQNKKVFYFFFIVLTLFPWPLAYKMPTFGPLVSSCPVFFCHISPASVHFPLLFLPCPPWGWLIPSSVRLFFAWFFQSSPSFVPSIPLVPGPPSSVLHFLLPTWLS